MKCNQAERLLSEYIDNSLSARDTWEIERHLCACTECSRSLVETRRTVASIAATRRFEASADFAASVQARLRELEPAPARRAWFSGLNDLIKPRLNPAFGAVCATALIVVVFGALPRTDRVSTAPTIEAKSGQAFVKSANSSTLSTAAGDPFEDLAALNLAAMANSPADNTVAR